MLPWSDELPFDPVVLATVLLGVVMAAFMVTVI